MICCLSMDPFSRWVSFSQCYCVWIGWEFNFPWILKTWVIHLGRWEGADLTWNFLYCYFALSIAPHTHPLLWQLMTHVSPVAPLCPLRTFLYDNRLSASQIAINLYIFKGNSSFPLLISLINLCAQFTVPSYVVGGWSVNCVRFFPVI